MSWIKQRWVGLAEVVIICLFTTVAVASTKSAIVASAANSPGVNPMSPGEIIVASLATLLGAIVFAIAKWLGRRAPAKPAHAAVTIDVETLIDRDLKAIRGDLEGLKSGFGELKDELKESNELVRSRVHDLSNVVHEIQGKFTMLACVRAPTPPHCP